METGGEYDMDSAVGYLIGHVAMRIKIGLRRLFMASGLDVTPEQWVVLFRLREREGLTQSELGERTIRDKATVTRILDRLEKKALVERRRDAKDRRSQRIFLTEKGGESLDALMPLVRGYGAEVFGHIDEKDRELLRDVLARIEVKLDSLFEGRGLA